MDLGYRPPHLIFKKNRLRGIPLLGKFIPKITNFGDFCGCKPTFFTVRTVKFGVSVRTLDTLPALNFVKKIAQEEIFTKNLKFSRFLAT